MNDQPSPRRRGVCRWHECQGCDSPGFAGDALAARQWVNQQLCDPVLGPALRRQELELGDGVALSMLSEHELTDLLAAALAAGRLRACGTARRPRLMRLAHGQDPAAPTPAPERRAASQRPGREVHWIEIEVLGEDGVGIANVEYLIVTPDQRQHRGVTDRDGRARLERIDAGECQVSFPKLDQEAWVSG
jgi:hypothetical protein